MTPALEFADRVESPPTYAEVNEARVRREQAASEVATRRTVVTPAQLRARAKELRDRARTLDQAAKRLEAMQGEPRTYRMKQTDTSPCPHCGKLVLYPKKHERFCKAVKK